jgi:predicted RNA-binding protein with PUA-like domain
MAHWLLKTEPEDYSWDDLATKGAKGDAWTGVRNFTARRHLKEMKKGERAFLYHTGDEKRVMGIVEVVREAYPDPTDETGKFLAVDLKAVEKLPKPVSLSTIKVDRRLADMLLVHQPRLSVQPVMDKEWEIIGKLGGM